MDSNLLKICEKPADQLAQALLGKILVRKKSGSLKAGIIVETEAYLAENDAASHAAKKRTKRNEPMFGAPGTVYVYFTYGMHWLFNIVCCSEDVPSAVLVRAVEPIYDSNLDISKLSLKEKRKFGSGPARLTKWLEINSCFNKKSIIKSKILYLASQLTVNGEKILAYDVREDKIVKSKRIGVDFAGPDAEKLLRFYIKDNKYVSKII